MTKSKSKSYLIVPFILVVLAIAVFYGCFFALAPWLADSIPPEGWGSFARKFVYILIAYFGGLGIPMALIAWAVFAYIALKKL